MEQLKAMEELNRERKLFEAELFLKTATGINALEIEKLNAMSKASVEALIAASDPENARILGDVEISKHKRNQSLKEM